MTRFGKEQPIGKEQPTWQQLDARDGEKIQLMWNPETGTFRVIAEKEDSIDETPELSTFEAARDCYDHPHASETLGVFVMRNHAEAVVV